MCAHVVHIFTPPCTRTFCAHAAQNCAYVQRGQYACRHPPFTGSKTALGDLRQGRAAPVEPSTAPGMAPLTNPCFFSAFTKYCRLCMHLVTTLFTHFCWMLIVGGTKEDFVKNFCEHDCVIRPLHMQAVEFICTQSQNVCTQFEQLGPTLFIAVSCLFK